MAVFSFMNKQFKITNCFFAFILVMALLGSQITWRGYFLLCVWMTISDHRRSFLTWKNSVFHACWVIYIVKVLDYHAKHGQSFKKWFRCRTNNFCVRYTPSGFVKVSFEHGSLWHNEWWNSLYGYFSRKSVHNAHIVQGFVSQKQLWSQVPSLPIEFNGTNDHS